MDLVSLTKRMAHVSSRLDNDIDLPPVPQSFMAQYKETT
jgi:hypothetical protein